MAHLIYTPAALRDLERFVQFLLDEDRSASAATNDLILRALEMLRDHPLLGRRTSEGLRELVISRGKTGYLAMYDYEAASDFVIVLGIRHQREAGYREPSQPDQES